MARLYRLLRSRRLAIYLIVGIVAYSLAMTFLPRGSGEWRAEYGPAAAQVASTLGLTRPFSNAVFVAVAALLLASTVACSWERTVRMIGENREIGRISAARLERLRADPDAVIEFGTLPADQALRSAASALATLRMRVRSGPSLVEADGNRWGRPGSPLFHWSLALLFLCAALGQLTRAEGGLNLPFGRPVPEVHGSYIGGLVEAPLFLERHTGALIQADSYESTTLVGGVHRGASAVVRVTEGGRVVAQRRVYPNSPLRYRSLMIHREAVGPLLVLSIRSPQGDTEGNVYFESSETAPLGARPAEISIPTSVGPADLRLEVLKGKRIRVSTRVPGSTAFREKARLGQGDSVSIGPGVEIEPKAFTSYFRVRVVNDWSIGYIYALFLLGTLGVTLAMFLPPRRVWLMVRSRDGAGAVHVLIYSGRVDPAFRDRCVRAVERALIDGAHAETSRVQPSPAGDP